MGITDFVLSNLTNGDCQTYSMINGNHEIKNYTEVNYTASRRHSFDLIIFPGEYCHVEVGQKLYWFFLLYNPINIINLKTSTFNRSCFESEWAIYRCLINFGISILLFLIFFWQSRNMSCIFGWLLISIHCLQALQVCWGRETGKKERVTQEIIWDEHYTTVWPDEMCVISIFQLPFSWYYV